MTASTGPSARDGHTLTFTQRLWADSSDIRTSIDELAFVTTLADGTLDRAVFLEYLAQDAYYLRDYARALSTLAALAPTREAAVFWAKSAGESVETEQILHDSHLRNVDPAELPEPSPTCVLYTSFLIAEATRGNYATLAAAVLPCFVVYDDVGRRLAAKARNEADAPGANDPLEQHPYGDWILTYEDEDFAASAEQACVLVDEAAEAASEQTRARMAEAYLTATRCEWMFWDAAARAERWPV